jgi:hypothetical protein
LRGKTVVDSSTFAGDLNDGQFLPRKAGGSENAASYFKGH